MDKPPKPLLGPEPWTYHYPHPIKRTVVLSLSRFQLFVTPWTAAYQAPLSMGFSRQEYWSGVPLPSPRTTIQLNNSNPRDILKTTESRDLNRCLHTNLHSRTIHSGQKIETTQTSINRQMNKKMWCIHSPEDYSDVKRMKFWYIL